MSASSAGLSRQRSGDDDDDVAPRRSSLALPGGRVERGMGAVPPIITVKPSEQHYKVEGVDFYKAVFGGEDKPLCKQIDIPGCDNAVAATSWNLSFADGNTTLYDSDGRRRALHPHCDVHMLMPEWVDAHKADKVQQRAVAHFIGHTATHERGHGQACSSLATSITLLVANMPVRVPKSRVAEFNRAFKELIELFTRGARTADAEFDKFTGHGGEQDAQLGIREDQEIAISGKVPEGPALDFQTAVRQSTAPVSTKAAYGPQPRRGGIAPIRPKDVSTDDVAHSAAREPPTSHAAMKIRTQPTNFGGVPPKHTSRTSALAPSAVALNCLDGIVGEILGPFYKTS